MKDRSNEDEHPDLIWTAEDAKRGKYMTGGIGLFSVGWILFLLLTLAPSCPKQPRTAEDYFIYGKAYMGQNDFIEAQKWFSKAIKEKPRYYEAYVERIKAWEQTDSLYNAIRDYDTLLIFKNLTVDKAAELNFLKANEYYLLSEDTLACHGWKKACELNHNKACDLIRKRCK